MEFENKIKLIKKKRNEKEVTTDNAEVQRSEEITTSNTNKMDNLEEMKLLENITFQN